MTTRSHRQVVQTLAGAFVLLTCLACQPTFDWAVSAGSSGPDLGHAVTTDAAGNVYVAGEFAGTVDFDPGLGVSNLAAGVTQATFVAKYTPAGTLVWARRVGGSGQVVPFGVVVDAPGNVYVTGFFQSTCDFDPGGGTFNVNSLGAEDGFVLKLNAAGGFAWARRFGGAGYQHALSLTLSAGSLYVAGLFEGTADFDPGSPVFNLTAAGPGRDMFVLKLTSAAGLFQWARRFGGAGPQNTAARSVYADGGGGDFTTPMVMDSFTLTNSGPSAVGFVARLNGAGTVVFAGRFGPEVTVRGVAVDATGNVIATGYFRNAVDFNPGPGTLIFNSTPLNGFVLKLNPAGGFVWARRFASSANDPNLPSAVAVDAKGNIYTTGLFLGTTDFDPGATVFNVTSQSSSHDIFIAQLDAGGAFLWAGRQGGPTFDAAFGVSAHGCSSNPTQLNVTGEFSTTADFNPTVGTANLTSAGGLDIFTAQLRFPNFTVMPQHLYVTGEGRVLKYPVWSPPLQPPAVFVPANSGGISRPTGLAFGPDCNLYVSNVASNRVMRYGGTTGAPFAAPGNTGAAFFPSQSGGLSTPHGLTFGADARLYVASIGTTNDVLRYDGVTGALVGNFTGPNPPVPARGVTFGGPAGDLYVTSGHDVKRYDRATGALVPSWNLATDPAAATHYDLKFGPGGDLYVTAYETNKVLRFDGTTGAPLPDFVPSGGGGLSRPTGLAFGPDGRLYVSSAGTNQILRYDGTTGAFVDVFASGGGLANPGYLAFGP